MTALRPLAVLMLSLALNSCAESHRDIVAPYVEGMDNMKERWSALAQRLEGGAEVLAQPTEPSDSPKLILHGSGALGNAGAVALAHLKDPLNGEPPMDLGLASNALIAFSWTSEERRESSYNGGDADGMRSTLDAASNMKFLVVYEVSEHVPPRVLDDGTFALGLAEFDVHVVDLETQGIIARFPLHAESSDEVRAQVRSDETKETGVQRWLESDLWSRARESLAAALRDQLGAEVQL